MRMFFLLCIALISATFTFYPNIACAAPEETLSLKYTLDKKSFNFQKKNVFSFPIKGDIRLLGIKGSFYTKTVGSINRQPQSVSLFTISYTKSLNCPQNGTVINSYEEYFSKYKQKIISSSVVKQSHFGMEKMDININFKRGFDISLGNGGCILMLFDGTDFSNRIYHMQSNVNLIYTPIREKDVNIFYNSGLDAEFTISPSYRKNSLNAYSVIPVSKETNLKPGSIFDIYGNVSFAPPRSFGNLPLKKWSINSYIYIYKNGSCDRKFPNHRKQKFTWNDRSMQNGKINSPFLDKDSEIIFNKKFSSKGLNQINEQIFVKNLPVEIKMGDCIVFALTPSVDSDDVSNINAEDQIRVLSSSKIQH
ncbi:hypothetical protein [Acetobacter senegalensis]|uniref:hypothetical protein n=1 Tax=Acetobacter senegalensis TaxID=446692 RepID=UPI0012FE3EC7|nr:hypothetical protein [Acetobacter senegalensis]